MENRDRMATCVSCQEKFERKYMLEGRNNVLYCTECFKRLFLTASGDSRSRQTGDMKDKMFPHPEILSYHNRRSSPTKSTSSSIISLSKRPLQCPKADCNKFVSLFTLESHFKYEHKEVPIILTQLDARSALEFYPQDIRYGVTQCIVLLNVVNHDFSDVLPQTSCYCSKTNLQSSDVKPVMVLLAGRIAACHLNHIDDKKYQPSSDDDLADTDEEETIISSGTYVEATPHILGKHDKIVIWVASNVITNLSYTVAASTLSNKIRQKFFGPILALGDGPVDVCKAGTGLILTHYHVNGMSENGSKPLAVDVVIHSQD
ncbi:unnamed protein product [Phaedon cochleariae]|uniref:DUF4729 domain-containing protein n=1 Tax=Phaedon cochleariae TaxID=80249 RepID=A0A9P0GPZ9_PHACE|nr:unnamed protein product [Phaedon cochleariae]